MARAIALENKQDGTSNILLEDPDIAAILQMTKEKLAGQIMAGLLERPMGQIWAPEALLYTGEVDFVYWTSHWVTFRFKCQ